VKVELNDALRREYNDLFSKCSTLPAFAGAVERAAAIAIANKARYDVVSSATGVPWFVIAAIHNLECSQRFDQHLHNGDPLKARTVNVPSGRPAKFPCSWEESAIDALEFDGFDRWRDWSIAGALFKLESYNGFGSRNRGVHTPYLWCGSFDDLNGDGRFEPNELPIYVGGKYVKDRVWDPNAQSKQIGAAVLLHHFASHGIINWRVTPAVETDA
jgi:lysozyme family protein